MLNARDNYIEAIRFGRPEYVPLACEPVWHGFQFEGNFRGEDWTDAWGIDWQVGIPGIVPFPKGNPLPAFGRLADYRLPDPGKLGFTADTRRALQAVDRSQKLVMGNLRERSGGHRRHGAQPHPGAGQ